MKSFYRPSIMLAAWTVGFSAFGLTGCENPADDKPKAGVSAPVTTPAGSTATGAKTLTFGPKDSKIEFVGSKVTGKHDGSFGQFTGRVTLISADPTKSTVSVEIDAASISADHPKLTGHLRSADFFDVEKFPKARFESTSIKVGGANGKSHTVTGNLQMHGVEKSISFPANVTVAGDALSVDAEFAINRKDFGLNYPGKVDDLIRDEVVIKLTVRASTKTS